MTAARGRRPALPVVAGLRIAVVFTLVALAGCGGPITNGELRRGVETIASQAAEGALVADGAAQNRTKDTFTRVQADELAGRATHEAEKLADAKAAGRTAVARDRAVDLAGTISDALGELEVRPDHELLARTVARRLRALSLRTRRLADRL